MITSRSTGAEAVHGLFGASEKDRVHRELSKLAQNACVYISLDPVREADFNARHGFINEHDFDSRR